MITCQCGKDYPDNYDFCPYCKTNVNFIIELMIKLFRTEWQI